MLTIGKIGGTGGGQWRSAEYYTEQVARGAEDYYAGHGEAPGTSTTRAKLTVDQAAEIRRRLAAGETQAALRREFSIGASAIYRGDHHVGWRALCATLAYAGPRISEALDLRERDVRLHDPAESRLWIADSKTATGIRHVEVTPALCDALLAHRADKVRAGYPTGPDDHFFCTRDGARWEAGNVRQRIVAPAAELASRRLAESGLPPLPHITPHTLRRTYVSIMLLATNFDVPFVQRQVGHADSKLTMNVYAQLIDRSKRGHGAAFDALVTAAQGTLYGPRNAPIGPLIGPPAPNGPIHASKGQPPNPSIPAVFPMGAGGFEPPTSRV
jgi:integrase